MAGKRTFGANVFKSWTFRSNTLAGGPDKTQAQPAQPVPLAFPEGSNAPAPPGVVIGQQPQNTPAPPNDGTCCCGGALCAPCATTPQTYNLIVQTIKNPPPTFGSCIFCFLADGFFQLNKVPGIDCLWKSANFGDCCRSAPGNYNYYTLSYTSGNWALALWWYQSFSGGLALMAQWPVIPPSLWNCRTKPNTFGAPVIWFGGNCLDGAGATVSG